MITLENFSERNRERRIGNSLYRICKGEYGGKWYIHETYGDKTETVGDELIIFIQTT